MPHPPPPPMGATRFCGWSAIIASGVVMERAATGTTRFSSAMRHDFGRIATMPAR